MLGATAVKAVIAGIGDEIGKRHLLVALRRIPTVKNRALRSSTTTTAATATAVLLALVLATRATGSAGSQRRRISESIRGAEVVVGQVRSHVFVEHRLELGHRVRVLGRGLRDVAEECDCIVEI